MQAAFYERLGAARDVLTVGEWPMPEPGPHEVRVRIHVSGLNPTDVKARTGFSSALPYPRIIPHQDGAGVIDAIGVNVSPARIGERVWLYEAQYGRATGTAAEYVVVPSSHAVRLPDHASFDVGASLGIPALTAHRCLFADGSLTGRRVLVHGGAGVVGTAAILLAKWAGAWVAASVTNAEQATVAKENGADLVVDRHAADAATGILDATGGIGVDRIVDVDLKSNLEVDLACVSHGGVISSYAMAHATDELSVPLLRAMMHGCVLRFVYIYHVPDDAKQQAVRDVAACVAAGAYSPRIGMKVPLERIVDAHEALESGRVIGKVLVHNRFDAADHCRH
ncbi:NADPH:quinone reductase [Burkholderia sp. AU31624]|uniref:NADPH:quinone reductase n=1 Tax=unclassified Burkholderia TaxID=2613784 RepID=UPI000B7A0133|nr:MULTISPECIES: NADPH:quinone reductase [unclassified Burkholderia]MCA8252845.1 NADPH:quinone reductase [Burkholderia sp. AU31624]OXI18848.1 alcohol dehydrogenase [Burkholderia sp. AU15512]